MGIPLGVLLGLIPGNVLYGIPIGLTLGFFIGLYVEKKLNPHPKEKEVETGEIESRLAWIWVIFALAALMIISALYFSQLN